MATFDHGSASALAAAPPRFSWPMRLFLCYLVTNIVFRSLGVLLPWPDWSEELAMERTPRGLPTRAEMSDLAKNAAPDGPDLAVEEVFRAFDSVWDFLRPWPGRETRAKLEDGLDWGKWSVAWLSSRFEFIECLVGFDQEWPMFSPSVAKERWLARARLSYADGSVEIIRQNADPEDLTCYSHWFQEKILDHELHVRANRRRAASCQGYCNLLAHRHSTSAAGSSLQRISLYDVCIKYPAPDEDPAAVLRAQNNEKDLPADQIGPVFYIYDVAKWQGKWALQ
jgi:hypothetical protein